MNNLRRKTLKGNQIDGGVTKEVEEEGEANILEFDNHSRIKFNEISIYSERVMPKRSRLFTGGQSITFFDTRLKTKRQFRMMKCKKLYHPKMSYVRIQIPRKGYFYRSYASLKVSGSSSCLPSRVEPPAHDEEGSSEVQVSRMAAASSEISSFYEKELNNTKKKEREEGKEEGSSAGKENENSNTLIVFEGTDSEDSDNYVECDPVEPETSTETIISKNCDSLPLFENLKYLGHLTNQELVSFKTDQNANDEGDVSYTCKKENSAEGSVLSQYLVKCIHGGDNELFNGIRVNENEESKIRKPKDVKFICRSLSPSPKVVNCSKSSSDLTKIDETLINLSNEENVFFCEIESSVSKNIENKNSKTPVSDFIDKDSEEKVKLTQEIDTEKKVDSFFMQDIDLHMELENYLKAAQSNDGNFQIAKARTRNTLQKNQTNWTRDNGVFSEDNVYDSHISNCHGNNRSTNKLVCNLGFTEDIIPINSLSRNNSSGTFASAEQYSLKADDYSDNANEMCLSRMNKSNENFLSFAIVANPEDYFSVREKMLWNSDNMKIAKSEYNSRQFRRENTASATSVKRSFGRTSFESIVEVNENGFETSAQPKSIPVSQILLTSSNQTAVTRVDDYERIFPLSKWPARKLRRNINKGMSDSILFKNLDYSLSSDSFRQCVQSSASDYNRSYFKGLNFRRVIASDSTVNKDQRKGGVEFEKLGLGDEEDKDLSIQDVIDIYNNILNENEKIKSDSDNSQNTPLLSYVKDLLKEKKVKSDLYKLPCKIDSKVLRPYVLFDEKHGSGPLVNSATLANYVNMFQAVLMSSLSINEISNLNNIISGVPDPPPPQIVDKEENCEKKITEVKKPVITENKNDKNNKNVKNEKNDKSKNTNFKQTILAKQKSQLLARRQVYTKNKIDTVVKKDRKFVPKVNPDPKLIKKKNLSDIIGAVPKKTNPIKRSYQPQKKKEPFRRVNYKQEKLISKTIELSSPVELDSILKTHLQSAANEIISVKKNVKPAKVTPQKLLVTVKMNGDKIMVNSVSRITNDIPLDKPKQNPFEYAKEISDLIIEGIPKKQNKNIPSSTRGTILRNISNVKTKKQFISKSVSSQEILRRDSKTRSQVKKIRPRPETSPASTPKFVFKINENGLMKNSFLEQTQRKSIKKKKIKKVNAARKEKEADTDKENKEYAKANMQIFEYDQEILKAQHPLEAIVEKSESRLTENTEKPGSPMSVSSDEVSRQNIKKSVKKTYKKLERVDEILRQIFLNNPLFPKLLQSKLNTLFWDLKTSKNGIVSKDNNSEGRAANLNNINPKVLNNKSTKPLKITKSLSDVLAQNDKTLISKEMLEPMEKCVSNKKDIVDVPFESNCDSYCFVVKSVVENKKLKSKKVLKEMKNDTPSVKEKFKQKQERVPLPAISAICALGAQANAEQEVIAAANKTLVDKNNKKQSPKVKSGKKVSKTSSSHNLKEQKNEMVKKIAAVKVPAKQTLNNTILFLNNEISQDCCSLEYLCNDISEDLPAQGSDTSKKTYVKNAQNDSPSDEIDWESEQKSESESNDSSGKKKKKKVKPIKSEVNILAEAINSAVTAKKSAEEKRSNSSDGAFKGQKESPIIIHPANMEGDDISFPSLMIQSESVIKSQSTFPVTKSQIKNLFNSNSDRRFFPGRISENFDEKAPFVTFFLTPRQNDIANLTTDRVKIVNRENPAESHKPEQQSSKKEKEIDGEISLENVEKFIEFLSKSRKKAVRLRDPARRTLSRTMNSKKFNDKAKMAQQMKNIKRCRRFLDSILPPNHYPQCEIQRKLIKTKAEMAKEQLLLKKKMLKSTKLKSQKKTGTTKPPNPGKILQITDQNELTEKENKASVGESKLNPKLKAEEKLEPVQSQVHVKDLETPTMTTIMEDNEKELNCVAVNNSLQEHKAKSEKNYFAKKSSRKNITKSCELLNFVKEVISTAPDSKTKKEIIEVIEEYSKTLQNSLIEKGNAHKGKSRPSTKEKAVPDNVLTKATDVTTEFSKDNVKKMDISTTVKKKNGSEKNCKSFTIKIRCNNNATGPGATRQKTQKAFQRKNIHMPKASPLNTGKGGNMKLLNSLVSKDDSNSNDLSRVSSIYFDADDKFGDVSAASQRTNESRSFETKFLPNSNCKELNVLEDVDEEMDMDKVLSVSLKPSDVFLLSEQPLSYEYEEKIFEKIMKYLQENNVNYAMTLVEGLLKRSQNYEKNGDNRVKMKNLLKEIENKSRTLIENIEKTGWLRVLSLIEEVAVMFDTPKKNLSESVEETELSKEIFKNQLGPLMPKVSESLKNLGEHVNRSKIFINTVKSFNESGFFFSDTSCKKELSLGEKMMRLLRERSEADAKRLEGTEESFLSTKNVATRNSYMNNIIATIGRSYNELKRNYLAKGGSEQGCRAINSGIDQGLEIHKTSNALEIPEKTFGNSSNVNPSKELFLNEIKKQIQHQKEYVLHLLNTDYGPAHSDIQGIKKKVAYHLESLEKVILRMETSRAIKFVDDGNILSNKENIKEASFFNSIQNCDDGLDEPNFLESESEEFDQQFDCRPERNENLKNSLNYLVLGGIRSFNKSYSTSFDVGSSSTKGPY